MRVNVCICVLIACISAVYEGVYACRSMVGVWKKGDTLSPYIRGVILAWSIAGKIRKVDTSQLETSWSKIFMTLNDS